jgi:hypothetical protein
MYIDLEEKETLVLDPLLDQQVKEEIKDPSIYMLQSLVKINRLFQLLYQQYGASVQDFNEFLLSRDPLLHKAIDKAWLKMDTGVQEQYDDQQLDRKAYKEWKQDVVAWKRLVSAAVQLYHVHKSPIESDVSFNVLKTV